MNKVKNLGYDRWLIDKQPRQESGFCCFSFVRYLQNCVTHFCVPWRDTNMAEESNISICQSFTLESWHIEINCCSSAITIQLVKTKAITHLLTYATTFSGRHFHVTQRESLELQLLYYKKNPVELKHCETSSSYGVSYLMKLKPEK